MGAAIIAGVGKGVFSSYPSAVASMVELDKTFEPDAHKTALYAERYARYAQLWPLLSGYLRESATPS